MNNLELISYLFSEACSKSDKRHIIKYVSLNSDIKLGLIASFLNKNRSFKLLRNDFIVVNDFNLLSLLVRRGFSNRFVFVIDDKRNIFIEKEFVLDNRRNIFIEKLYKENRLSFISYIFIDDVNLLMEYLEKIASGKYIDILFMVFDVERIISRKNSDSISIIRNIVLHRHLINWYNIDERNLGDNFIRVFEGFINLNNFIKHMKISEGLLIELVEEGRIDLKEVIYNYDYLTENFIRKFYDRLSKEDINFLEVKRGIKL